MTETCLAILLIHGVGAAEHADTLREHYGATRAINDVADAQNGDLLLREDDVEDLDWIASNVILLPGDRAPIVRKIALEDALLEVANGSGEPSP
jgi:hypothetical protein